MVLIPLAVAVLAGGGLAAWLGRRSPRAAARAGAGAALVGSALLAIAAVRGLGAAVPEGLAWAGPAGDFVLGLDPLSAWFLLPLALVGALGTLFGAVYLPRHAPGRAQGTAWLFFDLLLAAMTVVFCAFDPLLFLCGWEAMTVAAYALVVGTEGDGAARRAGWIFLIASHLGTACLLAFFAGATALPAGALLVLALVGFGVKAGLVPFHVWLPEAHPAAPSHVSALMSGVMVTTGIYGLLRWPALVVPETAAWPGWFPALVVGAGAVTAVWGALQAVAPVDLKRVLAYSTVENSGLMLLGVGLGFAGRASGQPAVAALGFAAALLHVLQHALFKAAAFCAAGAVKDGAHSLDLDRLGGLWHRTPRTARVFLVAALAGTGLPPLGAFVGEFLLVLAALAGLSTLKGTAAATMALALGGVGLAGGLAIAAYARAFGIGFLGAPRSPEAAAAREPAPGLVRVLVAAATLVLAAAVAAPFLASLLSGPLRWPYGGADAAVRELPLVRTVLLRALAGSAAVALLAGLLASFRRALLAGRPVGRAVTWDCGYAAPTARMQYTASSFGRPVLEMVRPLVTPPRATLPSGPFPAPVRLAGGPAERLLLRVYWPAARSLERMSSALKWIQHGRVQYYVLYIAATLVLLLAWKLGR